MGASWIDVQGALFIWRWSWGLPLKERILFQVRFYIYMKKRKVGLAYIFYAQPGRFDMYLTKKELKVIILLGGIITGVLFWGVYGNAQSELKEIALTFDDGPHPYYTEQLLDGLLDRGVQVTFFVTGEHASLHPDVIKRMHEEGHLIGNHTYSHIQLRNDNREVFKKELILTSVLLEEITGEEISYVRPPYGTWDKSFEEELNMIPVLWTVDPLDWCSDNVACITERVVERVDENDIILMHDYYETSVTAALEIVDELLEEGYTFVTVEEIMFE